MKQNISGPLIIVDLIAGEPAADKITPQTGRTASDPLFQAINGFYFPTAALRILHFHGIASFTEVDPVLQTGRAGPDTGLDQTQCGFPKCSVELIGFPLQAEDAGQKKNQDNKD